MTLSAPLHPAIRDNRAALVAMCPRCGREVILGPALTGREICSHFECVIKAAKPVAQFRS